MKKIVTTIAALLITVLFYSQSFGEIQGKISDEKGDPMPYVYVVLKTPASIVMETETDLDGKFKLKPIPVGTYVLEANFMGYHDIKRENIRVNSDKITRLYNMQMTPSVTEIPTADIFYTREPMIDAEETSMRNINMDDFKNSPTKTVTGVITAISSDIKQGNDGELYFRGSRNGSSVMYLDGVKIMGNSLPSIPSSAIYNVMVYTGGIPAKYGDTTGGVIVIETKNFFTEYYKRLVRAQQ